MRKGGDKYEWSNLHIKEEALFVSFSSSISNQVVIWWYYHNTSFEGQLHTHTHIHTCVHIPYIKVLYTKKLLSMVRNIIFN